MGARQKEIIADKEDILKMKAMINHVPHTVIPTGQEIANRTPMEVATPLPPRNLSQIGKL
tara:strand:+ start:288 stop:467 length:180 start_codon:yes stop_codon:yes gene_type:complete